MNESDILYQNGDYWVCNGKKYGYEVYCDTNTHAIRCAVIGIKGESGLKRAISECDKRSIQLR